MTTTKNNEHKKLNVPNKREQNQTCLDSAEREGLRPKGNVPDLRFPEFQGEWKEHKLEDITAEIGDGIHATPIYDDNGTFYFVNGNNISEYGIIITATTQKVTEEEALRNNASALNSYSILLSINGTVGNVALYKNESIMLGKSACYINVSSNINRNYIFYYLMMPKCQFYFTSELTGTTIKNLSLKSIRKTKVLLPNANEQSKIARLFDAINERIATQNKIIGKLQSLIKGLNDTLYAQHGDEVMTSFAELGTLYSGLSGKSAHDFGSGKPFITYLNVYSNNVINENDFQYVAIKDGEKQNVVEYGDVLFTLSSETPEEVGIGSVYLGKEKVYLNSFCFGIHITNTKIAFPPYLSYYVSSTAFRKFIYPYAQGSTRFNLCKADFEKASIKLPTLENQKRIYSILSHIDNKIETERQTLELYNSQKQYLLRQMFI